MKYLVMITLFVIAIATNCYATVTPPKAVAVSFKQKFPTATNIKWGKENAHEYEAEFVQDGLKYSANFSESGKWLETESTIDFNSLPQQVKTNFNAQHTNAKKKEVAKIEKADGTVIYEIEITEGVKSKDCLYKTDGTSVK